MNFSDQGLYHIYNRGNNRQRIFFKDENYWFFIDKMKKFILPHCDLLAWCLMPNHFHILIATDRRSAFEKIVAGQKRNVLSEGFRNMLSSYSQAINKQNGSTGSLFQQNTKAKAVAAGSRSYDLLCFHYIHQNPLIANLVKKMEDWQYSSFRDYCDLRKDSFCNIELATQLLGIKPETIYPDSYQMINADDVSKIT